MTARLYASMGGPDRAAKPEFRVAGDASGAIQLALTTATAAHAKSGKFGSKRTRRSCVSSQVLRSVIRQASPHRMGAVAPAHASAMNRANRTRIRTGPRNNRQPSIARSAFQTAESAIAGAKIAQGVEQI